ncbi:MAG: SUMF1/EgtB/PvdO family nonheme iron enzyme [Planctomycetes bacterium]|nr:SUMF1/EgtB/PvdO family nonheme iron enzyme [Planctomycetota bacterium]
MPRTTLRFSPRAPISIGILLTGICAQSTTGLVAQNSTASPSAKGTPSANGREAATEGLPAFLLLVPGGTVEMGLSADELLNSAAQVVSPTRPTPAIAAKIATQTYLTKVRLSASSLGEKKVDVAPFFLAKWPVKCGEYEKVLTRRRAAGEKVTPPFDWWRYGREDHFNSVHEQIGKEFPNDPDALLNFWERHGPELPFAIPKDKKGNPMTECPVTTITFRQANEFAAAFGMRLPTEAEFTRAARGDGTNLWPWGKTGADVFTEEALKQMRLFTTSDKELKPVGTVAAGTGPFGHLDLFGQVQQFMAGVGYRPINGADAFAAEWKSLQKDKVGALVTAPPTWDETKVITKGGSYLSGEEPITLLIDARLKVMTIDALQGVGFRLAKSPKPGYDLLFSLLRGTYNRSLFERDQDIDLSNQIGAERYEFGPDGFPTAYHAVSFAPMDQITIDKTLDLAKLVEKSLSTPMLVGTFATTEPLADPAVPAGHYTVLFRRDGMPRELVEAIKTGHRDVVAMRKSKAKPEEAGDGEKGKDEKAKDDKGKKQDKPEKQDKRSWREITLRYGITEDDLASKEAETGLGYIRMDGVKVPTDKDYFLLHDNDGKIAAAIPAAVRPVAAAPFTSSLAVEASPSGKAHVKFHFATIVCSQNPKKVADVHFAVTLDSANPTGESPWRLPTP